MLTPFYRQLKQLPAQQLFDNLSDNQKIALAILIDGNPILGGLEKTSGESDQTRDFFLGLNVSNWSSVNPEPDRKDVYSPLHFFYRALRYTDINDLFSNLTTQQLSDLPSVIANCSLNITLIRASR